MVTFRIGNTINLCASIVDFCGTASQILINHDINASVSPNLCNIEAAIPNGCISLGNKTLEFQWTNASGSSDKHNCGSATLLKVLGSSNTNSNGVASLQYTITQNDLDLYNANTSTFDIRVCIKDTNTEPTLSSKTWKEYNADSIVIEPFENYTHTFEIGIKPYSWYTPQSAADWIINNIVSLNGRISNLFSTITGWQYVRTDIVTEGENVIVKIRLNKLNVLDISPQAIQITWGASLVIVAGVILIAVGIVIYFKLVESGIFQQGKTYTISEVSKLIIEEIIPRQITECRNNNLPGNPIGYANCVKSVVCGAQNGLTDALGLQKYGVDCASLNTNQKFDNCITQYNIDRDVQKLELCINNTATVDNLKILNASVEKQLEGCIIRVPFSNSCIIYDKDLLTLGILGAVAVGGYIIYTNNFGQKKSS